MLPMTKDKTRNNKYIQITTNIPTLINDSLITFLKNVQPFPKNNFHEIIQLEKNKSKSKQFIIRTTIRNKINK